MNIRCFCGAAHHVPINLGSNLLLSTLVAMCRGKVTVDSRNKFPHQIKERFLFHHRQYYALSINRFCDRVLYETDNRFSSQYESICLLAVFCYSALRVYCGNIRCRFKACIFEIAGHDPELPSIVLPFFVSPKSMWSTSASYVVTSRLVRDGWDPDWRMLEDIPPPLN